MLHPKKIGKSLICRLLEAQVKRLRRRNEFIIIAVVGSVGKTSAKLAIARTLVATKPVIYQEGNYNDRLTVPLILFEQEAPSIFDIPGWIKILLSNRRRLKQAYPYEVAVVELGPDGPGQLQKFAYLRPDITVLTAIADEHIEYFGTLDRVAVEEMTPLGFSKQVLLGTDDIPKKYLPTRQYSNYGLQHADYTVTKRQLLGLQGQKVVINLPGGRHLSAETSALGLPGVKAALSAVAVADLLGLSPEQITRGLAAILPVAGRMQVLAGRNGSNIIDDTYNASPVSVKAALDVLYDTQATQRIAILGSMNELGDDSARWHQEIGDYCDPGKLDLVVTVGTEARDHLAPAALKKGCSVEAFDSPYDAGRFVADKLKKDTVVLAKGSQNGVFTEEAVKLLLAKAKDTARLVRQSPYWLETKRHQFPEVVS